MQRNYEIMFIVRPDIQEEELDKLIHEFESHVANGGGAVKSTEKLGRRKLAYVVKKFTDGIYVLLTIDADGSLVGEIERRLRVSEPVIKFITVRMDEEEKRRAKVRALRASHRKASEQHASEGEAGSGAAAEPAGAAAVAPAASGATESAGA